MLFLVSGARKTAADQVNIENSCWQLKCASYCDAHGLNNHILLAESSLSFKVMQS